VAGIVIGTATGISVASPWSKGASAGSTGASLASLALSTSQELLCAESSGAGATGGDNSDSDCSGRRMSCGETG